MNNIYEKYLKTAEKAEKAADELIAVCNSIYSTIENRTNYLEKGVK